MGLDKVFAKQDSFNEESDIRPIASRIYVGRLTFKVQNITSELSSIVCFIRLGFIG